MALTEDSKQHVKHLAEEVLEKFQRTALEAKAKLSKNVSLTPNALASVNTLTSSPAIISLRGIDHQNRAGYELLSREPAIARVVVEEEEGKRRTYYFCRGDQGMANLDVISYRAPLGRLASLPIGAEFWRPDGRGLHVIERTHLRPAALPEGWDSRNTIAEARHFGPVTIESLRALLTEISGEAAAEEILEQLLAAEADKANIIEGLRRSVIIKMGLRDQPVLDQYQDEIFRLPLDKRLLLLGPPGTGKTTTLIRRLGQKLDTTFLEESEKCLVDSLGATQGVPHSDSWLMFTPTELLKQYLKEAFAREGVPASDLRIHTWHDYRRELGRNAFGVLRTATGEGTFVLKEELQSLNAVAWLHSTEWYSDFDTWQRKVYFQELHDAAVLLSEAASPEVREVGSRLASLLERASDAILTSTFAALAVELPKVQALVASLKEVSDAKIKGTLNFQLNRNREFLDELACFLDELQQTQVAGTDETDDSDSDEEEETTAPRTGRAAAFNAFFQTVRAQARLTASKRSQSKTSRTGKIIEWLGDRTLAEADRKIVGASLLVQTSARRFANPVKRYFNGIPKRYRVFRRRRQEEGIWYLKEGFEARDIHPLELDLVLLAILRATADLIREPNVLRDIDNPAWSSLQPFLGYFQNQILVDEATDFSPIQLACMGALAHPRLRSFFACGDFNQRVTTWGAQSADDLKWVFPDLDIKEITVSYRQSKQLNELARAMIHTACGTEHASLPAHVDSNGVAPALLEGATGESVVAWLAERIREIERFVGQLPSTAIFVNSETEVARIADALNTELAEHNIQVIACREGQAVGQESNVRVFDVHHIKGLEFEAVFFVAIDLLAAQHPELFDKYLYVGTSRAATYLGLTCEGAMPRTLESLRTHFGQDWQSPGEGIL